MAECPSFMRENLPPWYLKKYLFYPPGEECNAGKNTGLCERMTASPHLTSHPEMITVDFALVQITCGASRTIYSSNLQWTEPYGSPLLSTRRGDILNQFRRKS